MSLANYWQQCAATVEAVAKARPQTASEVAACINATNPDGPSSGDAFWSASGGDDELWPLLDEAGWHVDWMQADYYWQMSRDDELAGGQTITYIEGDVYANKPQQPM